MRAQQRTRRRAPSHRWPRRLGIVGAIVLLTAVLVAGGAAATRLVRSHPSADRTGAGSGTARVMTRPSKAQLLAASVTFAPARGTNDVPPDTPILVHTTAGQLTNVRVDDGQGTDVSGAFAKQGAAWFGRGFLQPGAQYTVIADVMGPFGLHAQATSTFRTLTPTATVGATLWPDQLTVGVAQPVVVKFDQPVTSDAARASAIDHFHVSATRPVAGGWHWFSNRELHFRPQTYWPTGDQVTVQSDLNGWNAGDGRWGTGAHVIHFTIGDSHIATANLATHQMTVTDNGKVVATYPMSGGRPKYPTMNGHHVVLDRESVVHMVSSSNGIPVNSPDGYDEMVYFDVHISDSGEYVHAAPWSVSSQGSTNVSHGCINLSNTDAYSFFTFSRVGDIVEVVGGPRPPALGDHGVMDWDTPWSQWTPAVVQHASA